MAYDSRHSVLKEQSAKNAERERSNSWPYDTNEGEQIMKCQDQGRRGFVRHHVKWGRRSFHSRGQVKQHDMSPTVIILNKGVTRPCPSAELRER